MDSFLLQKRQYKHFNSSIYALIIKIRDSEDITEEIISEINYYLKEIKDTYLSEVNEKIIYNTKSKEEKEKCYEELKESEEYTQIENSINDKSQEIKRLNIWGNCLTVVLAILIIFGIIKIIGLLFGWVYDSKYLFQNACEEGFFTMLWQFLLFGIWTVIKVGLSIAIIVGLGCLSFMVVSLVHDKIEELFTFDLVVEEESLSLRLDEYNKTIEQINEEIKHLQMICMQLAQFKNVCNMLDVKDIESYENFGNDIRNVSILL